MESAALYLQSDKITPESIIQELRELPSAPKVLPRLKQLLSDANSSMQEIVMLIRYDPGIAARVLRLGNSAYYNRGGIRCLKIDEAVNMVGFDQIYELVSYAVASAVIVRPLTIYNIEADEMWRRSVTCALAAEVLATVCNEDRDAAYTLGLLHGIGMTAIDAWALRNGPAPMLTSGGVPREYIDSERALLGFTQAEVGSALLQSWDFDCSIWEPIRWQYAPRGSVAFTKMTALLYVAKWLRATVCEEGVTGQPDPAFLQILKLTPSRLNTLIPLVRLQVHAVRSLLEVS